MWELYLVRSTLQVISYSITIWIKLYYPSTFLSSSYLPSPSVPHHSLECTEWSVFYSICQILCLCDESFMCIFLPTSEWRDRLPRPRDWRPAGQWWAHPSWPGRRSQGSPASSCERWYYLNRITNLSTDWWSFNLPLKYFMSGWSWENLLYLYRL